MGDVGKDLGNLGVGTKDVAKRDEIIKKVKEKNAFDKFAKVTRTLDGVRISGKESDRPNITFSFRITNSRLSVTGFNRESGARSTVDMPLTNTTLSRARGDVAGMRDLLSKSKTGVTEASFRKIANQLQREEALKS